jgi:hypothetical protein
MSFENPLQPQNPDKTSSVEGFDVSYTLDMSRENKVIYLFKNVAVVIDKSGKNIKDIPEILFGVFPDVPQGNTLSQPVTPVDGVTMKYVAACIKKVVEDCGENQLWFHPYGDDVPEEQRERREQARYRLFSQYANIEPGPEGYGYIINI